MDSLTEVLQYYIPNSTSAIPPWHTLSREILKRICIYIPPPNLLAFSLVSKQWNETCLHVLWLTFSPTFARHPDAQELLKKYGHYLKHLPGGFLTKNPDFKFDIIIQHCPNLQSIDLYKSEIKFIEKYESLIKPFQKLDSFTFVSPLRQTNFCWKRISEQLNDLKLRKIKFNEIRQLDQLIELIHYKEEVREVEYIGYIKNAIDEVELICKNFTNISSLTIYIVYSTPVSTQGLQRVLDRASELTNLRFLDISCKLNIIAPVATNFYTSFTTSQLKKLRLDLYISHHYHTIDNVRWRDDYPQLITATSCSLTHLYIPFLDAPLLSQLLDLCPNIIALGIKSPLPVIVDPLQRKFAHLKRLTVPAFHPHSLDHPELVHQVYPAVDSLHLDLDIGKAKLCFDHWNFIPILFPTLKSFTNYKTLCRTSFHTLLSYDIQLPWQKITLSLWSDQTDQMLFKLIQMCPYLQCIIFIRRKDKKGIANLERVRSLREWFPNLEILVSHEESYSPFVEVPLMIWNSSLINPESVFNRDGNGDGNPEPEVKSTEINSVQNNGQYGNATSAEVNGSRVHQNDQIIAISNEIK